MRTRKTLALTAAILSLGVPVAAAAPDGYQPDAIDRYLANIANDGPDGFQPQLHASAQPDAVDRYVANVLRQADLPDSTGAGVPVDRPDGGGTSWLTGALGCSPAPRSSCSRSPARLRCAGGAASFCASRGETVRFGSICRGTAPTDPRRTLNSMLPPIVNSDPGDETNTE